MKALHISDPGRSVFHYHSSGPASITLHPQLAKKLRVLIYNGDADACVPCEGLFYEATLKHFNYII
eukprot:COSAG02_NODE_3399_length_6811_cov_16.128278_2_plen_66_part_00